MNSTARSSSDGRSGVAGPERERDSDVISSAPKKSLASSVSRASDEIQKQILEQLQRVNQRLDVVEDRIETGTHHSKSQHSGSSARKISSPLHRTVKNVLSDTESSDLPYKTWDHPKIKYFVRSTKLSRPIALPKRNIIDIQALKAIIAVTQKLSNPKVYKAVFLTAFFGFFRLSNIAPHAISEFDGARHFTGGDIFFKDKEVQLLLKWSKTMQFRNEYRLISLPRLGASTICPYKALKDIMALYSPGNNSPLFQIRTTHGWQVLTDSRVRKVLAKINQELRLPSNFYTFHSFRRSGASLAYGIDIPVKEMKEHGTWASDCVWRYIRPEATAGRQVSSQFRKCFYNA